MKGGREGREGGREGGREREEGGREEKEMRKSQMRGREKEDGGREGGRGGGESERRSAGGTERQRERKLSGPGLKKQLDVDAAEARQHARHHRARQPQRLPRGEWGGGGERDGASSLGASRTRTHAHVHPGTAARARTRSPWCTRARAHARAHRNSGPLCMHDGARARVRGACQPGFRPRRHRGAPPRRTAQLPHRAARPADRVRVNHPHLARRVQRGEGRY